MCDEQFLLLAGLGLVWGFVEFVEFFTSAYTLLLPTTRQHGGKIL